MDLKVRNGVKRILVFSLGGKNQNVINKVVNEEHCVCFHNF